MDQVKDIDKRPWIDREKINVKQFMEQWEQENLHTELTLSGETFGLKFRELLNVPQELFDSLEEDLSVDTLISEMDKDWKSYTIGNNFDCPSHVTLNSVSAQIDHVEECERNAKYRSLASKSLKYLNTRFLVNQTKEAKKQSREPRVGPIEVILNVQILRPMHSSHYIGESRKHVIPIVEQEFLCIGSQSLVQLKDEIICQVDANIAGDCSDDPEACVPIACEIFTSSFFFVDDTFYNDMRRTINIDYSQVIRDWATKSERGIGPLKSARMEETRFSDLTIRLGQPYLYVHQGNCEHMVVFTEMRMFSPQTDSPFIKDYPRIYKTSNRMATRCYMCHLNTAKWLVFENKRLPEEPYFFCQECFLTFNYDDQKRKIGSFKAYPYLDKSALL